MERKIGKLTTKEEDRVYLKESMWEQLRKNAYKKKNEKWKKKELRKKNKEEECKEGRKWYGITRMGKYTERLKDIMRREGIRTFRKAGGKLGHKIK